MAESNIQEKKSRDVMVQMKLIVQGEDYFDTGDNDSNSSDIAIFSSDDLDNADITNYSNGSSCHKQPILGPWWKKRTLESRENGDDDTDDAFFTVSRTTNSGWQCVNWKRMDSGIEFFSDDDTTTDQVNEMSHNMNFLLDIDIAEYLEQCIAANCEDIDLTNRDIEKLPLNIFSPLNSIISSSRGHRFRKPELQLYLGNNWLTYAPLSLWTLENLTILSLRNNSLTELPDCICWLKNLQVLNVGANQLRYLPAELLCLLAGRSSDGKLKSLITWPNPFVRSVHWWPTYGSNSNLDSNHSKCSDELNTESRYVHEHYKAVLWRTIHALRMIHETNNPDNIESGSISLGCEFVGVSYPLLFQNNGLPANFHLTYTQLIRQLPLEDGHAPKLPISLEEWETDNSVPWSIAQRYPLVVPIERKLIPSFFELSLRAITLTMTKDPIFSTNFPPDNIEAILKVLDFHVDPEELPLSVVQGLTVAAKLASKFAISPYSLTDGLFSQDPLKFVLPQMEFLEYWCIQPHHANAVALSNARPDNILLSLLPFLRRTGDRSIDNIPKLREWNQEVRDGIEKEFGTKFMM